MIKKIVFFLFLIFPFITKAQDEVAILPVYNPSHVQLKVMAGNRILGQKDKLFKNDNQLKIEAFAINGLDDKALKITELEVNLVRNGQKITSFLSAHEVALSRILTQAIDGDVIHIQAHKLYYKDNQGKWTLYTEGRINLMYSYYNSNPF